MQQMITSTVSPGPSFTTLPYIVTSRYITNVTLGLNFERASLKALQGQEHYTSMKKLFMICL